MFCYFKSFRKIFPLPNIASLKFGMWSIISLFWSWVFEFLKLYEKTLQSMLQKQNYVLVDSVSSSSSMSTEYTVMVQGFFHIYTKLL